MRHSVVVSAAASLAVIPLLAIAPLGLGPGFGRTLTLGLILIPGVALLGVGRVMVAAFTGRGAANQALIVGLVSFPLAFVAFLVVIPDHGSTGAAIVSCCSYVVASLLAALLFFRSTGTPVAEALVPRSSDLRDYMSLARRAWQRGAYREYLRDGSRWLHEEAGETPPTASSPRRRSRSTARPRRRPRSSGSAPTPR